VFAIVTITLLFVGQTLAFNLKGISGGAQGKAVAGADFGVATYERPFYYVAAALFVVALLAAYFVIRSKLGLALTAIRSDEDKARGIGVRTNGLKVLTFAVSVGIVTAAGGLWAYYVSFIYPQFAFDPLVTIAIVLMTFLGGRGTLWGPVIGAVVLEYGQKELAYDLGGDRIYLIAYAAIFLAIILLLPRGILPTVQTKRRAARLTKVRDAVPGQLPGSRPEGRTTEPPVNGSVNEVKA
jgi:branched-chain amino acid transport system permease protein